MVRPARANKRPDEDCIHHWRIATPAGETSTGVCRLCGASREFQNYSYRSPMTRTRRGSLNASASK